jgi:hypothetical protein
MASTEDAPAPDLPPELVAQEQRADQEPQLKYERLGGDVGNILEHDKASCLKASEKILALGSLQGVIHILDYSGNEVLDITALFSNTKQLDLLSALPCVRRSRTRYDCCRFAICICSRRRA